MRSSIISEQRRYRILFISISLALCQQSQSLSLGSQDNYTYKEQFISNQEYYIGLIINPCGVNDTTTNRGYYDALAFDCCMHRYGEGEYGYLKPEAIPFYSDQKKHLGSEIPNFRQLAPHDEILNNIDLVDESGNILPYAASRRADDEQFIDENCRDVRDPFLHCTGWLMGSRRSRLMAPCWDNNQTVDSTLDCFSHDGHKMPFCMQIGFTQTAFIHLCGGEASQEDNCGTFIEIHRQNGSPYDEEEALLSETKLTTRYTNGMVTTTIPLTYKSNKSRILCAYEENKPRVGSMVVINANTRQCCCPPNYSTTKRLGSFFCPQRMGTKGGPFAEKAKNMVEYLENDDNVKQYPFCRSLKENEDILMCSAQSSNFTEFRYDQPDSGIGSERGRFFTYPCKPVEPDGRGKYTSSDLSGWYESACSYGDPFQSCGLLSQKQEVCRGKDRPLSFQGELGKLTKIPSNSSGAYSISFNDGRTSYEFYREEFDVMKPDSNYELWWVQRRQKVRTVRKKKSFLVIHPPCTFDTVGNQYLPFAQLDKNGKIIEKLAFSS